MQGGDRQAGGADSGSATAVAARLLRAGEHDPCLIALSVIAGAGFVYCQAAPPSLLIVAVLLSTCLVRVPGRALFVFLLIAVAWSSFWAQRQIDTRLPAARSGEVVWVTGHVDGLPSRQTFRTRFQLVGETPPRRMRLSWYDGPPEITPGQCLRLKVKLETPHGSANPGTFDYEAWLWRQGIDATGYVKAAADCARPPAGAWIDRARTTAITRIGEILGAHPMRGMIEALTLGVRDRIDDDQWDVLRATGTSHLVAISGLHVGLIAGLLFVIGRWLGLRTARAGLVMPCAAILAFLGAAAYAVLAGFALPTQRALVMVAAGLFAVASMRQISAARVLALAAIVVIVLQPAAVIAPGFWLSFGAVAWLIYLSRFARGSRIRAFIVLQVGLVAGLMPVTLWFFGQASVVAPWINALLIPLVAFIVPALLLIVVLALAVPSVGAPLLSWAADGLGVAWPVLQAVAQWPFASIEWALPGVAALALGLLAIALVSMPRGLPGRWLALVLLVPVVIGWQPRDAEIAEGAYRLTVLDVGQGLATVIRTARHTLVFDSGPAYRTGFNAGEAFVVPYLRHVGRTQLDTMVISHGDLDHIGGAKPIERALSVIRRRGAGSVRPCRAGQGWAWDGVRFMFLYPTAEDADTATASNQRSCVLRVEGAGGVVLLTGDIEAPEEQLLIERNRRALSVDVLVVAHHGSASSSSPSFVAGVAPEYALISSGWRNRWGFPADAVVERLRSAGATIANTAVDGALMAGVYADGRPVRLTRWRDAHKRFWQAP